MVLDMHVLCAIDGTAAARSAAHAAAQLAERAGGELTLHDTAGDAVAAAAAGDLLVVGLAERGWLDRLQSREPQERLIDAAPCPVMVVPADAPSPGDGPVLLGFEEAGGMPAAQTAAWLAERLDRSVVCLRTAGAASGWHSYDVSRQAADGDVRVDVDIVSAYESPPIALPRAAERFSAAAIVVDRGPLALRVARASGRAVIAAQRFAREPAPAERRRAVTA
jgi:hypothetical protein